MPMLIVPLAVVIVRTAVVIAERMAVRKETIGTPSAIMHTLANTKYSTGIAKESCKG